MNELFPSSYTCVQIPANNCDDTCCHTYILLNKDNTTDSNNTNSDGTSSYNKLTKLNIIWKTNWEQHELKTQRKMVFSNFHQCGCGLVFNIAPVVFKWDANGIRIKSRTASAQSANYIYTHFVNQITTGNNSFHQQYWNGRINMLAWTISSRHLIGFSYHTFRNPRLCHPFFSSYRYTCNGREFFHQNDYHNWQNNNKVV